MTDTTSHAEALELAEARLELLDEEQRGPTGHQHDLDADGKCRGCGEPYNGFGDGWNGYCPDCADRIEAARDDKAECLDPDPTWCVQRLGLGLRFAELTSAPFTAQATFNEGPDGIVMTSLAIGGFKPDHPLTLDVMHALATEALAAVRADAFGDWMRDNGIDHEVRYANGGRRGRISAAQVATVATVFEALTRAGMKTRPFMAAWWNVNEATVTRWITHARRSGLLGPSDPRRQARPKP